MKKTFITFICLLNFAFAQHNTYYVGHSGFGWDLIVGEMVNDLAADAGIATYDYGYQFIGGTCLSNQWQSHATPQGGTDSRAEISTGNYDYLILAEQIPIQEVIYSSPWGCDMTTVQSVDSFYDLATGVNPSTRVYLMEFHNEIDQTSSDPYGDWVSMNAAMRPLWEQVADSVSMINGGQVCLVPVAAAFQAMADSVRAGSFPGISDWIDLFDPMDTVVATIHPTEETYYLVACVHYAVIFGQNPVGLTNLTFASAGWPFDPPTPAQAAMMQEIAWNVVSSDPYACLSPVTGIADGTEKPHVKVRQHQDWIAFDFPAGNFDHVKIFSTNGKLELSRSALQQNERIDTSKLPQGLYVYRLQGPGGTHQGKIMRF